jgi:hypothetical protein
MREQIEADWAAGFRGAIVNLVRRTLPSHVRQWPLTQGFRFETFSISDSHLVIVLGDQLGVMMMVGGGIAPFPGDDHPPVPRGIADAEPWQAFLNRRFELGADDAAVILPIHDSGKNAPADFELFTPGERELWSEQIRLIVIRQAAVFAPALTQQPSGALALDLDEILPQSAEPDLDMLANQVKAAVRANQPQAALDRLHTFVVNYVRRRCDERGIAYDRKKPLHSLFGEYVKCLKASRHIESNMGERILKCVISTLEAFNDVRNHQSFAHDNALLNYDEALLICHHVFCVIRYLNAIEARPNTGQSDSMTP